ncbi:MAG: hypothetical protein V7K67_28260 [Nostoc sp.]
MATGDWGQGGQGGQGKIIEEVSPLSPPNPQSPVPSPQYPVPSPQCPIPKTQLLLYLIPIIGFFPSLWTLYRGQGSREQLAISRLSVTLALTWLLGYLLLTTGAATSDYFPLRLFILNSFLTSGYFLVSVWLILRLMQGKSGRLPGFSNLAERVLGKYLS